MLFSHFNYKFSLHKTAQKIVVVEKRKDSTNKLTCTEKKKAHEKRKGEIYIYIFNERVLEKSRVKP